MKEIGGDSSPEENKNDGSVTPIVKALFNRQAKILKKVDAIQASDGAESEESLKLDEDFDDATDDIKNRSIYSEQFSGFMGKIEKEITAFEDIAKRNWKEIKNLLIEKKIAENKDYSERTQLNAQIEARKNYILSRRKQLVEEVRNASDLTREMQDNAVLAINHESPLEIVVCRIIDIEKLIPEKNKILGDVEIKLANAEKEKERISNVSSINKQVNTLREIELEGNIENKKKEMTFLKDEIKKLKDERDLIYENLEYIGE